MPRERNHWDEVNRLPESKASDCSDSETKRTNPESGTINQRTTAAIALERFLAAT